MLGGVNFGQREVSINRHRGTLKHTKTQLRATTVARGCSAAQRRKQSAFGTTTVGAGTSSGMIIFSTESSRQPELCARQALAVPGEPPVPASLSFSIAKSPESLLTLKYMTSFSGVSVLPRIQARVALNALEELQFYMTVYVVRFGSLHASFTSKVNHATTTRSASELRSGSRPDACCGDLCFASLRKFGCSCRTLPLRCSLLR